MASWQDYDADNADRLSGDQIDDLVHVLIVIGVALLCIGALAWVRF